MRCASCLAWDCAIKCCDDPKLEGNKFNILRCTTKKASSFKEKFDRICMIVAAVF